MQGWGAFSIGLDQVAASGCNEEGLNDGAWISTDTPSLTLSLLTVTKEDIYRLPSMCPCTVFPFLVGVGWGRLEGGGSGVSSFLEASVRQERRKMTVEEHSRWLFSWIVRQKQHTVAIKLPNQLQTEGGVGLRGRIVGRSWRYGFDLCIRGP